MLFAALVFVAALTAAALVGGLAWCLLSAFDPA